MRKFFIPKSSIENSNVVYPEPTLVYVANNIELIPIEIYGSLV